MESRLKVCLLRPTRSPTDSVRRATTSAATANKQQLLPLLHLLQQQRIFLLLSFRVLLFFPTFFLLGRPSREQYSARARIQRSVGKFFFFFFFISFLSLSCSNWRFDHQTLPPNQIPNFFFFKKNLGFWAVLKIRYLPGLACFFPRLFFLLSRRRFCTCPDPKISWGSFYFFFLFLFLGFFL
jgi:hypothetical protein